MKKVIIEIKNGTKLVQASSNKEVNTLINKWFNDDIAVFISVQRYPLYKNDAIIIKDTKNGKDELND